MSTPQSIINICSGVRLDNRYEHTIYFDSISAQQEYFAGKVVHTFSAYSYLRKSWPLQVEATMEQAKTWSYLYFRNGSGKTYYYFINNVEYKNDHMVELTLELDVVQTYLKEIREGLLPCFVERQHTETDVFGEHTLDEGLETGELMDLNYIDVDALTTMCILVLATINPNYANTTKPVDAMGHMYNSVFSGLTVWAVNANNWADLSNQLDSLSTAGFLDGIQSMWMYPKDLVTLGGESTWDDGDLFKVVSGCAGKTVNIPGGYTRPDGKTVKNNKLYCYPYNFLYMTNNQGTASAFRYERFKDTSKIQFSITGVVSPDASAKIYPLNYNGLVLNYEQGLSMGGYPSCAWDADVYKLWLAQNQNQHQYSLTTSGLTIAGGIGAGVASGLTGNIMGAVGGIATAIHGGQQIGSLMAQTRDMAIQPPQSRGSYSSSVNVSAGKHTFTIIHKGVTPEQLDRLDNYFTMYGYKLNTVRKPNLCARPAFTYIKTVGSAITANLCTEDLVKITSIFDRGVTFWVNGDKIADYTQNNQA